MRALKVNSLTKRFFATAQPAVAGVTFEMAPGEIMALLGESGSGKSTLLRMIAGLERPTSGEIFLNDRAVWSRRVSVPPEKRGIGMIFQDYALFPHFNVAKNIAYGLNGLARREKERRVDEMLECVGLQGYSRRYPHQLSGGQQQRVALARALAPGPSIILMDEPFSQLDANLKAQLRTEIQDIFLATGTTVLFVTHDRRDALSIADKVAILKEGQIQQIASPETLYHQPATAYIAQFLGKTNLVPADLFRAYLDWPLPATFFPMDSSGSQTESLQICIRPENLEIVAGEPRNALPLSGQVKRVTFCGEFKEVQVRVEDPTATPHELVAYVDIHREVQAGETVAIKPKAPSSPAVPSRYPMESFPPG